MNDLEQPHSRKGANRRRLRRKRLAKDPGLAKGRMKSEINVTPFVDVVLVLLIIFMVVTPMLQRGVDVILPLTQHHATQKDNGQQIMISVRKDGAIFLGQQQLSVETLEQQLQPLLARQPAPPVFVKGDARLEFAPMRKVLEACHRAGAPGVSLATQGKKE
ncbi:MAG: biopolymer transporter ExbD [Deltaproteobacteria bacterium]|nr:biopolymer transporter ExbD [Deltaproteobacteria bacterium]